MKKVIGICNLHDDPSLGLLTSSRPLGAVTFLGRYGLIDFTLSNFSNSGIDKMFVLVKSGMLSMRSHIGSGSTWTTNTIRGSVSLLMNEEGLLNPKFNTDVANIKTNMNIDKLDFDYAVIAPSFILACIDYNPIIEKHIASKQEISLVYTHTKHAENEFINCDSLKISKEGLVTDITKHIGRAKEANISMESFIVSKKALQMLLHDAPLISELYSLRHIISHKINNDNLQVNAIEYDRYIVPMLDIEHYISYSFKLLDEKTRLKLFKPEWPIYTTTHNTPPALYGKDAEVSNSFIANGSVINGKVKNCIISRDVTIEKGAELSNCIIFTNSVIGKNVKLKYVLTDKEVRITESKNNSGTPERFLYFKHGAKI